VAQPRILVADDQAANLLIVAHALKDEFEVCSTTSGEELIERASAGDVDLVLLDVEMPGLDGFEVCRRLKADSRTAQIPVIFLTARDAMSDEALGFDVGGVDYITKPIRPAIIRARVRTHLELKHARDLLEQLASVDALTGIANRRGFDTAVDLEWRRAVRRGSWVSLAIADVDDFKRFNDAGGHLLGDSCLRDLAASFNRITRRSGELAARYGGEEFALIFPDLDPPLMQQAMTVLLEGVRALNITHPASRSGPMVTVSVGAVSVVPSLDRSILEALEMADRLLYEAKESGRNRCVHADLATSRKTVITLDARRLG
jgi:diguanylate cyclase (GGDEF)-like protein